MGATQVVTVGISTTIVLDQAGLVLSGSSTTLTVDHVCESSALIHSDSLGTSEISKRILSAFISEIPKYPFKLYDGIIDGIRSNFRLVT